MKKVNKKKIYKKNKATKTDSAFMCVSSRYIKFIKVDP